MDYPAAINTPTRRALYNNLDRNQALALAVDQAVHDSRQDGWRGNPVKMKKVRLAIKAVIEQAGQVAESGNIQYEHGGCQKGSETVDELTDRILELVINQNEY